MGVLFLTPQWRQPSEVWIARQVEALRGHLVAIGARQPTEPMWDATTPALALSDSPGPRWRRVARRCGLPVSSGARTRFDILARAVADPRVSVVLVHYLDYALRFEPVWQRTDKPVFVHPHGYDTEWNFRCRDNPDQPYFRPDYVPRVRALAQRAVYIANSQLVRERLLGIGVPAPRIVLQHYGIPVAPAPPVRPPRRTGVEILYLGRLVDCKGPDLVIRAFERACERGLDARLTLAGDGHLRTTCELLRRRSAIPERIRLLGAVDAGLAERLRAQADIFTAHNCVGPLTGQEESFGVAFVEAMGAGLPVITGRSGGVCETIVHGATGYLIEPGDIAAHAAAFLELAHDPARRHRLGAAGWRRAAELFDCGERWAELRQLLGVEPAAGEHPPSRGVQPPRRRPAPRVAPRNGDVP